MTKNASFKGLTLTRSNKSMNVNREGFVLVATLDVRRDWRIVWRALFKMAESRPYWIEQRTEHDHGLLIFIVANRGVGLA